MCVWDGGRGGRGGPPAHSHFLIKLQLTLLTVIHLTFETGDETLKELETGVFVAAGRFVVEKDRPVTVEYRVSKIVKG